LAGAAQKKFFWQEDVSSLQKQASKLKVRCKAVLQALEQAALDVPAPILESLQSLTTKRLEWPSEFLLPSEVSVLFRKKDGSFAPSQMSPPVLLLNLLVVRVVVWQLLLRPKDNMLCTRISGRGQANLRMLASMLFCLCKLALPRGARDIGMAWLRATLQEDALASRTFAAELTRFCEKGVPTLAGWMQEASVDLAKWTHSLLKRARDAPPPQLPDLRRGSVFFSEGVGTRRLSRAPSQSVYAARDSSNSPEPQRFASRRADADT
jgi:hypothetical protein